ncbi:MAG: hypothetical protein M3R00_07940 [Pseudomonadota bacterium]|nr:hypothetical protein [Pseudomonadota bacterium]
MEYQTLRKELITELNDLYSGAISLNPATVYETDNLDQFLLSAPNRALQSRIKRFREELIDKFSSAPLVYTFRRNDKTEPLNRIYTRNLTYGQLSKAFGLTPVLNNERYDLVTNQIYTLISDITEDRLVPFQKIFLSPRINSKSGLKDIKGRHVTATIRINGEEFKLTVAYCMKANTKHRILVAEWRPLHDGKILLFPMRWLNNGFHDERYNKIKHFEGGSVVTSESEQMRGISL